MTMLLTAAAALLALAPVASRTGGIAGDPGPFAGEVLNWTVSDERTLYVEDSRGQWYRVGLVAPCDGLRSAFGIELEASPDGGQDASLNLVAGGQLCPVASVSGVDVPAIPPEEPPGRIVGPGGR
jgi:hypothetical protein